MKIETQPEHIRMPPLDVVKQPRNRKERRAVLANVTPRNLRRKWTHKWTTATKRRRGRLLT